jgi:hypothetical protein
VFLYLSLVYALCNCLLVVPNRCRYFRFFPDGTLLYRTSPLTVSKVAKSLQARSSSSSCCSTQAAAVAAVAPSTKQKLDQHVFTGKYVVKVRRVEVWLQQQGFLIAMHVQLV